MVHLPNSPILSFVAEIGSIKCVSSGIYLTPFQFQPLTIWNTEGGLKRRSSLLHCEFKVQIVLNQLYLSVPNWPFLIFNCIPLSSEEEKRWVLGIRFPPPIANFQTKLGSIDLKSIVPECTSPIFNGIFIPTEIQGACSKESAFPHCNFWAKIGLSRLKFNCIQLQLTYFQLRLLTH